MKVKETIAFIGKADQTSTALIEKLAAKQYPVILVDNGNSGFGEVSLGIVDHDPTADVAVVECAQEGCWEADVIILTEGFIPDPETLDRVKTVATQKTVISLSGDETGTGGPSEKTKSLQQLLPYSSVKQVVLDGNSLKDVAACAEESGDIISDIFFNLGYENASHNI
jgi:hypothetical protein